ncbi:MAG TPA: FAD-dependent oxidoreductase [Nocardioidaceae bacterium]|nr:FAD-dependent oxidoreductase [Nocardioidaceae bacterium]
MTDSRSFVIVGAGMAGARAAEELRARGFGGRVTLLGEERVRPYDRVPLSKHYLRFEPGFHPLFIHEEDYYAAHDIDLRLDTRAASIDVDRRQLTLESGQRLDYDELLLATGSRLRHLRVPGSNLDGVHYLRRMSDADRLRSTLTEVGRIVVIGAGFIGSEVAASARQLGVEVAMVGSGQLPMERALGSEIAAFYRDVHYDHGVKLHLGVPVEALRGGFRVEEVLLADGTTLAADAVVVGIGAQPRVDLARTADIALDNGIVTDERMATRAPGIHAAGDVAAAWHPALGRRLRLEHWFSARHQGPVAARNMLGMPTVYDRVPFLFTDQYDVWMEYTGYSSEGADLVLRGDPAAGEAAEFVAFWVRDSKLVAGMNVNLKGLPDAIAAIVASGRRIDPVALADPDVDLADL